MGCSSSSMQATSPAKGHQIEPFECLLACQSPYRNTVEKDEETGLAVVSRDFSQEPMYKIFKQADTSNDGWLYKGQVKAALAKAGIMVMDEERAFEWLDRNFENRLNYKQFRRAVIKASRICPLCNYEPRPEEAGLSSDSECEQEDILRTYWIRFDADKKGWCYADNVIDYLGQDWGIEVDPAQRIIERKLMGADEHGKINYRNFKHYFTAVPEDDLKDRVNSYGQNSTNTMKKFEQQLDDMLLSDNLS